MKHTQMKSASIWQTWVQSLRISSIHICQLRASSRWRRALAWGWVDFHQSRAWVNDIENLTLFILKYLFNANIQSDQRQSSSAKLSLDLLSICLRRIMESGRLVSLARQLREKGKVVPWNLIIVTLMQSIFRYELEMTTTLSWPRMISVLQYRLMS